MKLLCVIFLALIISHPVFLQKENAFPKVKIYQWEDVVDAKPDTIFGISFRKNRISSLPKELYQFTNLIYLNLEKNKFQELPENLDTLTKLKYLNISKNMTQQASHISDAEKTISLPAEGGLPVWKRTQQQQEQQQ